MNKFVILVLGLFLTIVIPLIDISVNLSQSWDNDTKYQVIIGLGILLFTLLATYISIIEEKIIKQQKENEIKNALFTLNFDTLHKTINGNKSVIQTLDKKELYAKLSELVLGSNEKLELMYLGDKPPERLEKFKIRERYIQDLESVVNQQIFHVKRIILINSNNKKWIKAIANKFKTKKFFSLYVIEPSLMPSMSIQVIDTDKVIVINISKNAELDKKHFFVHSEEFNKIFHGFYKVILDNCSPIIENGVFNQQNFNKYLK